MTGHDADASAGFAERYVIGPSVGWTTQPRLTIEPTYGFGCVVRSPSRPRIVSGSAPGLRIFVAIVKDSPGARR